jgi:tRNA (guanine-N7-)-methyltransferase
VTTLDQPSAPVATYNARRGRLRVGRVATLDRLGTALGVPAGSGPLDPVAIFGRRAPLVVEIGSGMGDVTAAMAADDPDRDYLAVEVHTAGVANLLSLVETGGLTNVRVVHGDAVPLLRDRIAPASLDAVHIFFPDPWPKARHHKRRLIQPAHVALLTDRLVPGGVLHCATDAADYAEVMLATLAGTPGLENAHRAFAPRPAHRPPTRYERRGLAAGRPSVDLVFRRRP